MATDATGTPTSLGIPKYNVSVDAPSGLGFNAAMDQIDTLIKGAMRVKKAGTLIGSRRNLNLIEGSGITLTVADDAGNDEVDVTVATSTSGAYARAASEVDVVSTTAETTVFSATITGGDLSTNKSLRFRFIGDVLQNAGAGRTLIVRIKLGASTLYASNAFELAPTSSASRRALGIDFLLGNVGAANVQFLEGLFRVSSSTAPTTGLGHFALGNNADQTTSPFGATGAVDTSANQDLVVTFQLSHSEATFSVRRKYAVLEVV